MAASTLFRFPLLKNRKVLAIDDDPNVLHTISLMMRSAGIQSATADTAEEALRRLPEIQPDLILLDYMMPGMNGVDFYQHLQSDPSYQEFRNIPVIMLTAKTDNYDEQDQLLRQGMSAYLFKPFGFGELINIIANTLTLHEVRNENQQLTAQLRDSRNYLQTLFNSIQDGISVQNTAFELQSYNEAAASMIHSSESQIPEPFPPTGKLLLCHQAYFGLKQPCPFCLAREVLEHGKAQIFETVHPLTGRDIQISLFPINESNGPVKAFIEIIRDITEKKKIEAQMIESSRMASLGALAMGVAHEINNPLCIILGFAQSLRKSFPPDHPAQDDLSIIEEESERCAKIVQDLLNYARPAPSDKILTDMGEAMQYAIALLHHSIIQKNIQVKNVYDDACPLILADPKKIRQVFINLLMNAIDAIQRPGGQIDIHIYPDSGYLRIVITDNGEGIDESLLPSVFEPFVSTKTKHGSGLGLSVCRSIIQEHGGLITIESKKNQGTCIIVSLPIREALCE